MDISTTLYAGILLLGSAHGAFLAIVLMTVSSDHAVALRLLALLTLTFAIDLGINFMAVSGYLTYAPRLAFIESVAAFLYGPLIYLYVLALTSTQPWHFSTRKWMHFVPFVVSIALLVPLIRLDDQTLVNMIYSSVDLEAQLGPWVLGKQVVDVLPRLLIGLYLVLVFRRLIQHGRNIREQFSLIEHISLNWLRNILIAFGALWLIYFVALAFGGKGLLENVLNVAIVISVYTLGYMGLRQPAIFTQREVGSHHTSDVPEAPSEKPKYHRSALGADSSKALLEELQAMMATKRPYLDSTLTLAQLADQLNLSPNYLSQVINQQTGSNFFDFINGHRVEFAKLIFADPAQARTNVLTIAMDSGFNSKSAFYTAFKHHTNMTPSEYRRSILS